MAQFHEKDRRLSKRALAAEVKALRLHRQKQLIRDRLRVLKNRKMRNITKLEIDEMVTKDIEVILTLKTLNFFSPRFFFFLNPALLNF
jgi:hypothetical protein